MNIDKYLEECLDVYEEAVVELVKNNYKKQERCNDIESCTVDWFARGFVHSFENIAEAFYEEVKEKNWQRVNDFLYQDMLNHLVPRYYGYDHCRHFHWALSAYACGAEHVIERIFPREIGLSTYGYPYMVVGTNLFMAMYYKDEILLKQAVEEAIHFVNKKTSKKWEKAVIQFVLDILQKDMTSANESLQEVCKGYLRCNDNYLRYSMEDVNVPAYGIYFLARNWLSEEEFAQIEMPEHKTISKGYVQWRLKNPTPELKVYVTYPKEMDVLNKIYTLPVAKVPLIENQESPWSPVRMIEDVDKRYWSFVEELKKLT